MMTGARREANSWRPHADVEISRKRAAMLQAARQFFADRDILEVDTPALAKRTVTDRHTDSLNTGCKHHASLFLQTSPEYFMKRLLAAGYPDIGQICKVFRDGEIGPKHLPEFTLAEWYRIGFDLRDIMQDTVEFVAQVLGRAELCSNAVYVSYSDAFEQQLQIDPLQAKTELLAQALTNDQDLIASIGDDRDAWLDLAVSTRLAPGFARDAITVLFHYPASQAALAQRASHDDRIADRFELYYGELELANGFVELRDEEEQRKRFNTDLEQRQLQGKPAHELDEEFLDALACGLPQCAGVAVGLDRLLMVYEEINDIAAISTFTLEHQHE